ncbi:MAG TPA: hypothetical protein VGP97_09435 [Burkholderiales bacterium]|nr:hypothetical protein [Burkholderiales bacterium]
MTLRAALAGLLLLALPLSATAEVAALAIVIRDRAALRAAPRSAAPSNALLWQGETLEVREERLDYLQVYDYRRERGGFVLAAEVQRISLRPEDASELLAIVRFLRRMPGAEALGIGFAAAYIEAAPAEVLASEVGMEALDALGGFAERLAERVSASAKLDRSAQATLAGHLDVAARYGVRFTNHERDGRAHFCYEGEAYRRVLAMPSSPAQRARAALAVTRVECTSAELRPQERLRMDEWRAEVLERVDPAALPAHLRNRILMRRAAVWAGLAYLQARKGEPAHAAAKRALAALADVDKAKFGGDEDARLYNDAAMQVGASRWAAVPASAVADDNRPRIVTAAGPSGDTCVLLVDSKNDARRPLARRCTYGMVWTASARLNREGSALALAVQPTAAWRELWIFRKSPNGWQVRVLPPAATAPNIGYAEFAGWAPASRMLVAREARGEGRYRRSFDIVRLDTLATVSHSAEASSMREFQRWQDASWKSGTVSLR